MPEISRFLGIVIAILYRDHEPPHFHATYGEHEITVGILDGLVTGRFPRRALGHVLENGTQLTNPSSRRTGSSRGIGNR